MSQPSTKPHLKAVPGADQRRIRLNLHLPLRSKRFNGNVPANITNLSIGGAFIATVPEREGRIIDFTFSFPNDPRLFSVTARVIWISQGEKQPPGFGIRFLRFHTGSAAELQEILTEYQQVEKIRKQKEHFQVLDKIATPVTDALSPVPNPENIDAVIEGYWEKFLQ